MGTPICQAVFSFFSKFFRGGKWAAERRGRRSLRWGCTDSPGCGGGWWRVARNGRCPFPTLRFVRIRRECGGDRWDVLRNGHNRSLHRRVRIRRGTVGIGGCTAERHGGRSLHWVFADSPEILGNRWGVLRNGHNRSLHGRVRIRRGFLGIAGVYCGTVMTVPYVGVLPCRIQV